MILFLSSCSDKVFYFGYNIISLYYNPEKNTVFFLYNFKKNPLNRKIGVIDLNRDIFRNLNFHTDKRIIQIDYDLNGNAMFFLTVNKGYKKTGRELINIYSISDSNFEKEIFKPDTHKIKISGIQNIKVSHDGKYLALIVNSAETNHIKSFNSIKTHTIIKKMLYIYNLDKQLLKLVDNNLRFFNKLEWSKDNKYLYYEKPFQINSLKNIINTSPSEDFFFSRLWKINILTMEKALVCDKILKNSFIVCNNIIFYSVIADKIIRLYKIGERNEFLANNLIAGYYIKKDSKLICYKLKDGKFKNAYSGKPVIFNLATKTTDIIDNSYYCKLLTLANDTNYLFYIKNNNEIWRRNLNTDKNDNIL